MSGRDRTKLIIPDEPKPGWKRRAWRWCRAFILYCGKEEVERTLLLAEEIERSCKSTRDIKKLFDDPYDYDSFRIIVGYDGLRAYKLAKDGSFQRRLIARAAARLLVLQDKYKEDNVKHG